MPTTTAIETLNDYVLQSTIVYRKGDIVKIEPLNGHVDVVTLDLFPALPEGVNTAIDCHFINIIFTSHLATLSHEEFYNLVISAKDGVFGEMTAERLSEGPSYIEIGGWLGDQTNAFRFMACAQAHGLSEIITPAILGIKGEQADKMASVGYIMLIGLRDPRLPALVPVDLTPKGLEG